MRLKQKNNIDALKEYVFLDRQLRNGSVESDYDKFCEEHCTDIEELIAENERLKREKYENNAREIYNLIMLIGLPGSGKSRFATEYERKHELVRIVSSDDIREEYSLKYTAEDNETCFRVLKKRAKDYMKEGYTALIDATNIKIKDRINLLDELRPKDGELIAKAKFIFANYDTCIKRNESRDRKVPNEVITRMLENFNFPMLQEGFYDIDIEFNDNNLLFENEFESIEGYEAINKKTLKGLAMAKILKCGESVTNACYLCDIGELVAKKYEKEYNIKFARDKYANIGAYCAIQEISTFLRYNNDKWGTIETLQLINWHEIFGNTLNDKTLREYSNLFGNIFLDKIRLITAIRGT